VEPPANALLENTALGCIFAAEDIPDLIGGTELRWNYELSEEDIRIIADTQVQNLKSGSGTRGTMWL